MDKPIKRHSEQGAALVMAIISLLIITGLATAMLGSARTEFMIANNEERAVHARMAAEAGLNHGVQVVADRLVNWKSLGFASGEAAVTDLLDGPDDLVGTDDGYLTEFGFTAPGTTPRMVLSAAGGTSYEVRVYDDDDTAGRQVTLNSDDITRILENNVTTTDANRRLAVHAIGYGPGATTTRLEAIVGPLFLPAVVSNGNLSVDGTVNIVGTHGSVHSNGNLTINGGGSGDITESCTASGTVTGSTSRCGGSTGPGRPSVTVPNVWAADYFDEADFILHDDGRMEKQDPVGTFTFLCDASSDANACLDIGYGWMFNSGNAGWDLGSTEPPNGAYYIEGNVQISGSPGSPTPVEISLIAEGYVDISGSPDLQPHLPETFIVTNKDLKIVGSLGTPVDVEGQVLVREQASINGNVSLAGQVIIQNASALCPHVTSSSIGGSVTITYNGLVGSNNFAVLSWREVR